MPEHVIAATAPAVPGRVYQLNGLRIYTTRPGTNLMTVLYTAKLRLPTPVGDSVHVELELVPTTPFKDKVQQDV